MRYCHAVFVCHADDYFFASDYLNSLSGIVEIHVSDPPSSKKQYYKPYGFCDNGIADGINWPVKTESIVKQGISWNWPLFDCYFHFVRKQEWEEHSWGVANQWDSIYRPSQTLSSPSLMTAKSAKKLQCTPRYSCLWSDINVNIANSTTQ